MIERVSFLHAHRYENNPLYRILKYWVDLENILFDCEKIHNKDCLSTTLRLLIF